MTTDNVADLAEARRPVRSADLSDGPLRIGRRLAGGRRLGSGAS
jgi:hypothetical protein